MTIIAQMDAVRYQSKPSKTEVSRLKQTIGLSAPVNLSPEAFRDAVLHGQSFSPGILYGTKAADWQKQQLFCIDIDNEEKGTEKGLPKQRSAQPLDVPEVLRRSAEWGIEPFLIYETFSSVPEWQKFRIVFAADRVLTDPAERDSLQLAIMELFPECDAACKNRDRLFYGGKSSLHFNPDAVISPDALRIVCDAVAKQRNLRPVLSTGALGWNDTINDQRSFTDNLSELKENFNLLEYIRSTHAGKEKRIGRLSLFNPCPICGHNDDFYVYPNNTFYCFSSSGGVGGSIIDYLMHRQGQEMDKKQAIEHFKYDLLGLSRAEEKQKFRKNTMLQKAANAGRDVADDLPDYIYMDVRANGEVRYLVSAPRLAEHIRKNSRYIFVRDKATDAVRRYWYKNGVYTLISDEELKGYIKKFITDYDISILKMRDVGEVFQDLITDNSFVSEEELNSVETLINFQNGLLDLNTMQLSPHSPDVLSTIQIPCNWNDNAVDKRGAPIFVRFLETFTDGDKQKKFFLLEYMGACFSNVRGNRFKSSLFIVGPGNTGKSQLKLLTERLLGSGNSTAIDLAELEGSRFGTSKLYGKRLAGSSDMSYVTVKELNKFKTIVGGDPISVEFKCKPAFEYRYPGFFWFCTNELPKFGGDRGEWVYDRIIALQCSHVIPPAEQDKFLLDRMYEERETIVYLAICAFRDAWMRGCRFAVPDDCKALLEEYKKQNSPVIQFYEECCMIRQPGTPNDTCTTKKIHDVFRAWCKNNNNGYTVSAPVFKKELAGYLGIPEKAMVRKTNGQTLYPFTLTVQAKNDYSREYGYDFPAV